MKELTELVLLDLEIELTRQYLERLDQIATDLKRLEPCAHSSSEA